MPRRQPDKAVKAVLAGTWRTPPAEQDAQDAQKLLASLADALNACDRAGFTVKLAHGAVITRAGYVLPVYPEAGERYAVRTMALTEFPVTGDDED
jgi:hypothetical protein